jgi:methionyl-tRNA formyltransferase
MKILFCINRDIHSYVFLDELINLAKLHADKALLESILTSTIFFTEGVGMKSSQSNAYLDFLKTYEMQLPGILEKRSAQPIYFTKLRDIYGLKIFAVMSLTKDDLAEEFKKFKADIIISIRFGKIFNDKMLEAAACPVINVHSGILPDYKGILTSFWSKKNNETEYGFTVHGIENSGIDTGSVFHVEKFKHNPDKCLFHTIHKLYPDAANFMRGFLSDFQLNKTLPRSFKQESKGAYFTKPVLDDFIEYEKSALKLFDIDYYTQILDKYLV